jgi:phage tail-like protein
MMPNPNGRLLGYLPAIYHDSEDLREFLAVFEKVLFGSYQGENNQEGSKEFLSENSPIADRITMIASLFDAHETPEEFLPWLGRWVALFHLEDLKEHHKRQILSEIVPLYAIRGTKGYLERLLKFFIPNNATAKIEDQDIQGFIVGTVKIGINSWLDYERPFWFQVTIQSPEIDDMNPESYKSRWEKQIRQVIDLAKPAHTLYELDWKKSQKSN